jgi:hypothetical protein
VRERHDHRPPITRRIVTAAAVIGLAAASSLATPAGARPATVAHRVARERPRTAPEPAALPVLPAHSTYARQILMALDPNNAEPGRSEVITVGRALDSGSAVAEVASIERSTTFLDPRVRALFQQYLDRPADPSGLAHWRSKVQAGMSLETLALSIALSPEAFRHAGTGAEAYVKWAYLHVLGRAADSGGLHYWVNAIVANHLRYQAFVTTLIRSTPRATKLVDSAYERYLRRFADAGGRKALVDAYTARKLGELDIVAKLLGSNEAKASGCDPFDTRQCLLPFPSDRYTVPDPTTATGRRVAFKPEWSPRNVGGDSVDPSEWNRNDGFSVGQAAITRVPGLDLAKTGAAPVTDIGSSLDADAPILVVDADTGEHHPVFAELDAAVPAADAAKDQLLIVHPAVDYTAGHRYIVVLRHLEDAAGNPIESPASFRQYRDDASSGVASPGVEDRRPHMEQIFDELADAGVARDDLYLAWDFTVASTANTTGRMLSIRDRALASLQGHAPAFAVTSVQANPNTGVAKRIEGTFDVPLFLTGDGSAGNGFKNGADGLPQRNGTYKANFTCNVPAAASEDPARPVVYGHGLFGDRGEVNSGSQIDMVRDHDMAYCATDWIGMSEQDVGNAAHIISDVSTFNTLTDRSQQGILNTVFLGRLMHTNDGFVSNAAFQGAGGAPLLDTSALFYDGNSQGAVIGGAYLAVSPDTTAGVLGVAGMNYSLLLDRSVDFDPFRQLMLASYPDPVDRVLGLQLIQMLWDRGETNGYAAHMASDPLPNTPGKRVLIHIAVGDHQVANVAAEIEARTAGIPVHRPAYADGRSLDVEQAWGLPAIVYPSTGSGLVVWDSGSPLAPTVNLPPRDGHDPHEDPRHAPAAQHQKDEFLKADGTLIDVCSGSPCTAPQD